MSDHDDDLCDGDELDEQKRQDDSLRLVVTDLLNTGLRTTISPVPMDGDEFQAVVTELAHLPAEDYRAKLVVAGFLTHPVEEYRCFECMYYKPHRKWCVLPELDLPAEENWWCRLWRI